MYCISISEHKNINTHSIIKNVCTFIIFLHICGVDIVCVWGVTILQFKKGVYVNRSLTLIFSRGFLRVFWSNRQLIRAFFLLVCHIFTFSACVSILGFVLSILFHVRSLLSSWGIPAYFTDIPGFSMVHVYKYGRY